MGETQKSDGCGLNLSTLTSLGFTFHTSKNGVQGDFADLLSPPGQELPPSSTQLSEPFLSWVRWPTLSSKTSVTCTLCQWNLRSPGKGSDSCELSGQRNQRLQTLRVQGLSLEKSADLRLPGFLWLGAEGRGGEGRGWGRAEGVTRGGSCRKGNGGGSVRSSHLPISITP